MIGRTLLHYEVLVKVGAGGMGDVYNGGGPKAQAEGSFNSQGPTLLQTLNILETFDLRSMGQGSADYVHILVEAMKLAYADRDSYYADPEFVKVPAKGLLSKDYAQAWAKLIDVAHASEVLRAGDPVRFDPDVNEWPFWVAGESVESDAVNDNAALEAASLKDTTHIAIIDRHGNIFDTVAGRAGP